MKPLVTVLMTIYNGERHLRKAIMSVLNQTYKNLELLIILEYDSSDNSYNIIKSMNDDRIKLVNNERRLGISESLNRGIKLANGKYIARLDADDFFMPKKIEHEVRYMEKHSDIVLCGTDAFIIDDLDFKKSIVRFPNSNYRIKSFLFLTNCFLSSSVMIKKEELVERQIYYSGVASEDYRMWLEIAKHFKVHNLSKCLTCYRINNYNRTNIYIDKQKEIDYIIQKEMWEREGIEYPLKTAFYCNLDDDAQIRIREEMLRKLIAKRRVKKSEKKEIFLLLFYVLSQTRMSGAEIYKRIEMNYFTMFSEKKELLMKIQLFLFRVEKYCLNRIDSLNLKC